MAKGERSKSRQEVVQRPASEGDGHSRRRDENTSRFEGADSAKVGELKGAIGGAEFHDYKPGKPSFRGDENPRDYNHKEKSDLDAKRDASFKDTGRDASSAPIDANRRGILGNTKNVARDPGKSGKNRTPGFGGKEGEAIAQSRRGGLESRRDTDEGGASSVAHTNQGGVLGTTKGIARNPEGGGSTAKGRARNVEGFHSGTLEGYVK